MARGWKVGRLLTVNITQYSDARGGLCKVSIPAVSEDSLRIGSHYPLMMIGGVFWNLRWSRLTDMERSWIIYIFMDFLLL